MCFALKTIGVGYGIVHSIDLVKERLSVLVADLKDMLKERKNKGE